MSKAAQERTNKVRQNRYRERMQRNGFKQVVLFVPAAQVSRMRAEAQAMRDEYFSLTLPLIDRNVTADD